MPPKQSLIINALVLLATLFIFVAVFEITVRIFAPQPTFDGHDRYSPTLARENIPDKEFIFRGKEFKVPIKYNSYGMRDEERNKEKDKDVVRIAVLGDSFMEGPHVPFEESFTRILENKLNNNGNLKTEALNFGVSSYGLGHYLIVLRDKALEFDPDVVALGITYNDFGDILRYNLAALEGEKLVFNDYQKEPGGFLKNILNKTHSAYFIKRKLEQSPALSGAADKALGIIGLNFLSESEKNSSGIEREEGLPVDVQIFSTPDSYKAAASAYKTAFFILSEMNRELNGRGIDFFVFFVPAAHQVKEEQWNNLVRQYKIENFNFDPARPGDKLADFAAQIGFLYFDLFPDFAAADKNGWENYFIYDGHWNAGGHNLAAELVAKELSSVIISRQNP